MSTTEAEAALFGRKAAAPPAELYAEAEEVVDVVAPAVGQLGGRRGHPRPDHRSLHRPREAALRRLRGRFFSVRGPSITPRPPQGHPIVAVDATSDLAPDRGALRRSGARRRADLERRRRVAPRSVRASLPRAVIPTTSPCWRHVDRAARARPRHGARDAARASTRSVPSDTPADVRRPSSSCVVPRRGGRRRSPIRLRPRAAATASTCSSTAWCRSCASRGPFRSVYAGSTLRDHLGLARPANRYRGVEHDEADPSRRALPGREQHDGVERSHVGQPDRLRVVRAPGADRRARQVRLLLPRRRPAPARAPRARSSTSTSSAGPTRSPCWPRWPRSPTAARSGRPRSTPRSTSRTSWPASSRRSTTSAAAARRGTR